MPIDREAARAATPGCRGQVFLDSAGSSLPTAATTAAVIDHLRREAAVGGYRAATERAEDLARLPQAVAALLGVPERTIALTDSATRAWTQFVGSLDFAPGDRILIAGNEYASNAIALLAAARRQGAVVEVVPGGPHGPVDVATFEAMLDDRVRLVSLVHVPTNSGAVAHVGPVVAAAHRAGAMVILDACQSVGQVALPAGLWGVDALSATGRKWLRAPRGTGFLYVREGLVDTLEPPGADLRAGVWETPTRYRLVPDARRFEQWEHDVAGRLGLLNAVTELLELGTEAVADEVRQRAARLRAALSEIDHLTLHDHGSDLSGIVTFTHASLPAVAVKEHLLGNDVTVSVSYASSTLLDMNARGLDAVVRASPHYFVSDADLDRAVELLATLR